MSKTPELTKYDLYEGLELSEDCGCPHANNVLGEVGAKEGVRPREIEALPSTAGAADALPSNGLWSPKFETDIGAPFGLPKCLPFLKLVKIPENFDACMKVAERVGRFDSARKVYDFLYGPLVDSAGEFVLQEGKRIYGPMAYEDQETFYLLCLDTQLYMRGLAQIALGDRDRTLAPIPVTIQNAVAAMRETGAMAGIISHQHPSGRARPSEADKNLTKDVAKAFQACHLALFDHVVIGRNEYFSFYEAGMLHRTVGGRIKRARTKPTKVRS